MRNLRKLALIAFATSAVATIAQDVFKPADFNVTKALIDNGFNVSAMPGLSNLVERSSLEGCSIACDSLKFVFGDSKLSQEAPTTYWSQQPLSVKPRCTFIPTAALEVSTLVLLSRLTQCPFAVKSGGHAAFPASSIEGGITVDLVKMNKLVLSADNKTVAVGPGNRWKEVYDHLTPYNLAVVGGRSSTVGVGGLTLGGGISHHNDKYGLVCDNIASYEVVSASGAIITVSEKTYPDLYWALRGGGNSFGVITTFNYETFPQGLMFSSKRQYNATHIPALLDAFGNAVQDAEVDTKAAHFVAVAYNSGYRIASAVYEYFDPVDVSNPPDVLNDYLSIPALNEATKNTTLAEITLGLTESMPAGLRTTMWSQSFKVNTELMKWMSNHFFEIVPKFPGGGAPSIAFQAFTKPALRAMQRKGGNALGLRPDDGPFFHPVISGYGGDSVARLNKVSSKYDPKGVFQTLQPTSFKLNGEAPFGAVVAI
ncbi:hypothetical protein COCCADRAFT_40846 [Bipolaris zeicola 26-R-13]|uniref:FAD-binding PCMH-type domain-containing protein n=1 Tax=Cochliobolus carbonum (strain 26-R-13) TaxID=930089 RepID=W6XN11_COCC2|nr:uncharacterized protein COCCADRAFT_40846 [Bipolaris zeicola 26-R-13]EUC28667.1 hypothetical protein COCCADRAFT_40846 [Bipolaris zeicola 26-R-13]